MSVTGFLCATLPTHVTIVTFSERTVSHSVNCGYDPLCDCSCLLGTLHFRALLSGERFTQVETRTGVFWIKQKRRQPFVLRGESLRASRSTTLNERIPHFHAAAATGYILFQSRPICNLFYSKPASDAAHRFLTQAMLLLRNQKAASPCRCRAGPGCQAQESAHPQ